MLEGRICLSSSPDQVLSGFLPSRGVELSSGGSKVLDGQSLWGAHVDPSLHLAVQ